ncbi:hypothetical protein RHMOL_Rhmol04G0195800 [Rhododendron molle]|uniref:Uncharacterized protein n=1 Tax=Rhododendron molle TaxID=49168 RepID=A0ACC0P3I7_RHOML|nr:hypothetical protein RHMOL_Rhmol04G0195800 [Rhododendron molle]
MKSAISKEYNSIPTTSVEDDPWFPVMFPILCSFYGFFGALPPMEDFMYDEEETGDEEIANEVTEERNRWNHGDLPTRIPEGRPSLRDRANRAHLAIRAIQLQPFILFLFCAVLTLAMPRWFGMSNRLTTFWYWVLVVAIALTAFGKEYERRALQAFADRWRLEA